MFYWKCIIDQRLNIVPGYLSSGQIFCSTARISRAFSGRSRCRRVEPVSTNCLRIICQISTVAALPPCTAMLTCRPCGASTDKIARDLHNRHRPYRATPHRRRVILGFALLMTSTKSSRLIIDRKIGAEFLTASRAFFIRSCRDEYLRAESPSPGVEWRLCRCRMIRHAPKPIWPDCANSPASRTKLAQTVTTRFRQRCGFRLVKERLAGHRQALIFWVPWHILHSRRRKSARRFYRLVSSVSHLCRAPQFRRPLPCREYRQHLPVADTCLGVAIYPRG